MAKFEIMRMKEVSHPHDGSKMYLVQIAVDGKPCIPFWEYEARRRRVGEEAWLQGLCDNAQSLIASHGVQPAMN